MSLWELDLFIPKNAQRWIYEIVSLLAHSYIYAPDLIALKIYSKH